MNYQQIITEEKTNIERVLEETTLMSSEKAEAEEREDQKILLWAKNWILSFKQKAGTVENSMKWIDNILESAQDSGEEDFSDRDY